MYKFNIEFGDISSDGHGMTRVFSLECSVSKEELESLYDKAKENTGFNFAEELCDEYGVNYINISYLQDLKKLKNIDILSIAEKDFDYKEDGCFVFGPEAFLYLFLDFINQYSGKNFTYKINSQINDRWSIYMGYGLFNY